MNDLPELPQTLLNLAAEGEQEAFVQEVRSYARVAAQQALLDERERCARLCETLNHGAFGPSSFRMGVDCGSIGCANAIRKGEQP